jgi:DNA-binding XRE family transcriptional regulator
MIMTTPSRNDLTWMREKREALKLDQGQCAKLVGVSRETWNAWEQGRWYPAMRHIRLIAAMLRMEPAEVAFKVSAAKNSAAYWHMRDSVEAKP